MILGRDTASVLRYPGGKARGARYIMQFMPPGLRRLASPFFGGGGIEFACARHGIEVAGYDKSAELANFWACALADAPRVAALADRLRPMTVEKFREMKSSIYGIINEWEKAAAYFALNRSSFGGFTLARKTGVTSRLEKDFGVGAIRQLARFRAPGVTVGCADFRESLARHEDDFLYVDPPYFGLCDFYWTEHEPKVEFDHEGLARILRRREGWVLSYNNVSIIRDLYRDFEILTPAWQYGLTDDKTGAASKEVLILSQDTARKGAHLDRYMEVPA